MLGSSRVLELGCGVGFVGITVAQLQLEALQQAHSEVSGVSLCLSDVRDDILARCTRNVNLECSEHVNVS